MKYPLLIATLLLGVADANACTADQLASVGFKADAIGAQHICKPADPKIIKHLNSVAVYKPDGTFVCELDATTQPVSVSQLLGAQVLACNSGLTLLAVLVGERRLWVDRNDVTLSTDTGMVSCTKQAPSRQTANPNVSVGAGENCSSAP